MGTTLKPETEARISDLARRLGFAGPNEQERVIEMALDSLDAKTPRQCHQMTPEEVAAEYSVLSAAGRRWREEHPGVSGTTKTTRPPRLGRMNCTTSGVCQNDGSRYVGSDSSIDGRNGRAGISQPDTFACALASVRRLPLLFKGDDFPLTDIAAAV